MTTAAPARPRHVEHDYPPGAGRCSVCARCARCGGRWDVAARDEFGNDDPYCLVCGARPRVDATSLEDPSALRPGMQRRRRPSHGGSEL